MFAAHPYRSVLELHYRRLAAVVEPVRSFVAGVHACHVLNRLHLHPFPGPAVIVGKCHGGVIAFLPLAAAVGYGGDPAISRLQVD